VKSEVSREGVKGNHEVSDAVKSLRSAKCSRHSTTRTAERCTDQRLSLGDRDDILGRSRRFNRRHPW